MRIIVIALTAFLTALPGLAHPDHRILLGFVEWITLEPVGLRLKARLDTGALTSSLHAVDVEPFERGGENWVRFRVPVSDHAPGDTTLRAVVLERPVARRVLVKRKGAPSQERYVVQLPFCLNGSHHTTEFSLTDRGEFNYPALLGRRFLKDVAIVDPAADFQAPERCDYTPLDEFQEDVLELEAADFEMSTPDDADE